MIGGNWYWGVLEYEAKVSTTVPYSQQFPTKNEATMYVVLEY